MSYLKKKRKTLKTLRKVKILARKDYSKPQHSDYQKYKKKCVVIWSLVLSEAISKTTLYIVWCWKLKAFFSLKMCPKRLQSGKCHNSTVSCLFLKDTRNNFFVYHCPLFLLYFFYNGQIVVCFDKSAVVFTTIFYKQQHYAKQSNQDLHLVHDRNRNKI